MEPTISKSGSTGASQTEGQSLAPNTKTNPATTQSTQKTTNQDIAGLGGAGNQANQTTGYGKSSNT